jgi:hypothetical protein
MVRTRMMAGLLAAGMTVAVGWAQQTPPAKTPQAAQGEEKNSTAQDVEQKKNPEEREMTWDEFVADTLTPKPYPKKTVVFIDDKYAYPHVASAIKMEVVKVEGDTVWLKGLPPEDPESPLYKIWARREAQEAIVLRRLEAEQTPGAVYFMDFGAEQVPPAFMDGLRFESAGEDLPDVGRWQMGFAVADMNGDGHPDLVFPPQRKAVPARPTIFLGDGAGNFSLLRAVRWPAQLPFDYGDVAAADFNGDGNTDLAIAVHFKSQYVMYGDGHGNFEKFQRLPSPDPRMTSRAVTSADFNGDGRPDLAFIAEIDYDLGDKRPIEGIPTVWVVVNRGDSWQLETEGLPEGIIADVIRSADLNGDGRPDLVLSSNTLDRRRLAYINTDDGWKPAEPGGVLSAAYHYDVEAAGDQLYATFVQFKMVSGKNQARNGIIRYQVVPPGGEFVEGQPLVWDSERGDVFFRLATGDLDGDGDTDVVAGRKGNGLEVYLQNDQGELVLEQSPELAETGRAFDIRLFDVDGDGIDDIVAGFVPQAGVEGGIHVWLTRPAA